MDRRRFVRNAGALAGGMALAGCARQDCGTSAQTGDQEQREWKLVTTWPRNFPGLGTGANDFAEAVTAMSGGRLKVKVYGAGDLVPAFEVFDAVSRGTAELGHGAAYYWKGKHPATQFFAGVPFGFNALEMNAWLYHGGGLDLWTELYSRFNLVPFPCGNTGVQMGGWFNTEINSLEDLQGLKMRIPGLGGEVLSRAGGTPVTLPGGELFTALQSGAIDATEWVGPLNDLAFGLYQAAKYYYYPGWHEPGPTLECIVNKSAFESLPEDLQAIVRHAARSVNDSMLADFTAHNGQSLNSLIEEHGVELRRYPDEVLDHLRTLADEVIRDSVEDELGQRILDSFLEFREQVRGWHQVSEMAYYQARGWM